MWASARRAGRAALLEDLRGAHGWRSITRRAAIACSRRAAFQSSPGGGSLDLADDDLDDAIEQVVLVADVAVEGHRVDAELLAELAHAQRLDAAPIGEVDGGPKHALAGQRRAAAPCSGACPGLPR